MVSKPKRPSPKPKIDTKKVGATLSKVGGAFKDVAVASASHPTVAALFIMGSCGFLQLATGAFNEEWRNKNKALEQTHVMLNNIYNGAQAIGVSAALAPIAVSALSGASNILGILATKKAAAADRK